MMNPAMMGGGLQTFTAARRRGRDRDDAATSCSWAAISAPGGWASARATLAGAIVYGLIAGVLVIVALVAVFIVAGIFMQASPSLGAIRWRCCSRWWPRSTRSGRR